MTITINGSGTITGVTTMDTTVVNQVFTTPKATTTIGVGNATPSASGAGITFPAAVSASSDANTLDDYEEGSWTPSFTTVGGGLSVTYTAQFGSYIKIGKLVHVIGNIQLSNKTANGTGGLQVSGLPFTLESVAISEYGGSVGMSYSWASNPCTNMLPLAGTTTVLLNYNVSNSGCVGADLGTGAYFRFSITYRASA